MSFYKLARDINLPNKSSKAVYPTTTLTFWGLELDTVKFEICPAQDKLDSMRKEVQKLKLQISATLKQLQSLIGLLSFAREVVPPVRTFLRRLMDLTVGLKNLVITVT